jgi:hypothetical protein
MLPDIILRVEMEDGYVARLRFLRKPRVFICHLKGRKKLLVDFKSYKYIDIALNTISNLRAKNTAIGFQISLNSY